MIVQTEWVKPLNQTYWVCQLVNSCDFAVSLSVTLQELKSSKLPLKVDAIKKQAKLSLMDLVSYEVDKALEKFELPNITTKLQRDHDDYGHPVEEKK